MRKAVLPPQCEVFLNEGNLQLHAQCPGMQKVTTNCHTVRQACLRIHPATCIFVPTPTLIRCNKHRHRRLMLLLDPIPFHKSEHYGPDRGPKIPTGTEEKHGRHGTQLYTWTAAAGGSVPGMKKDAPAGTSTFMQCSACSGRNTPA